MGNNTPYSLTPMAEDFSLDIPNVELDVSDEQQKRSISKTKRWKEFVVHARSRQELYRRQTPGGTLYNYMPKDDAAFYGAVGNAVIEEYENMINFIENS